jgi:DNA-binding transcriptional LysR family regulator
VIIAGPAHHLAGKRKIPFAALADEALILPARPASARIMMDRLAEESGIRLNVGLTLSHGGARRQAAAHGLGVADCEEATAVEAQARGEVSILDIAGFPVDFELTALWNHRRELPSTERAISALTTYFRDLPGEF